MQLQKHGPSNYYETLKLLNKKLKQKDEYKKDKNNTVVSQTRLNVNYGPVEFEDCQVIQNYCGIGENTIFLVVNCLLDYKLNIL
jgi:hypothetical protein